MHGRKHIHRVAALVTAVAALAFFAGSVQAANSRPAGMTKAEYRALVLRSEAHIGVGRPIRHADIELVPLFEDEMLLVVSARHPFATRGKVSMAELAGERLVLFDRTSSYHDLTSSLFRQAGVVPANVCISIANAFCRTYIGLCASAAGMCRTFIHRSARHLRNSTSSAATCSVRTTAVVPS